MAVYANQRTIVINREPFAQKDKPYLQIDMANLTAASRDLTPTAFRLYLYLASNANGYEKDYSPQHFANTYGVSIDGARKAPKELESKGYIVNGGGKLQFYEVPHSESSQERLYTSLDEFVYSQIDMRLSLGQDDQKIIDEVSSCFNYEEYKIKSYIMNKKLGF